MHRLPLRTQLGEDRHLWQRPATVRELGELRVDGLDLEQGELVERVGFQRGLL
ncbi:hypothetical protein [Mumia sp. Pv 4-285]|uniref:hypothetical protein n=1 Tax=Mumia qirimensis TaxID=3234852 RepID=UPI00351CF055